MKLKHLLYSISTVLFLSSCSTTSFYQVYEVKPFDESITKSNKLIFDDENCQISYNLWSNGGNIGFNFYNKTNFNIYIKLNESNFILNGFANDYFKNRTYTTTKSKFVSTSNTSTGSLAITGIDTYENINTSQVISSISAKLNSSVGYSVSIKEDSIVCIPPRTTKIISEYSINNYQIRDCELYKYPRKNQIKTLTYSSDDSPIVFSNRITYEINGNSKVVTNKFYVSGVTNYPYSDFFVRKYEEFCGQKSYMRKKHYRYYDVDRFFIKYTKGEDYWKH